MKALIVDDSALARRTIIQALKQVGFEEFEEAADGTEAVDKASNTEFRVIMMDWNMPQMDGIEAVRLIREQKNKTPIIMVTGLGDEHHVKEAIKMGVNNFIVKPFRPEKAATIIQDTLNLCAEKVV